MKFPAKFSLIDALTELDNLARLELEIAILTISDSAIKLRVLPPKTYKLTLTFSPTFGQV